MLMRCDELIDNFDWNIIISQKENMRSNKKENAKDMNTKAGKNIKI